MVGHPRWKGKDDLVDDATHVTHRQIGLPQLLQQLLYRGLRGRWALVIHCTRKERLEVLDGGGRKEMILLERNRSYNGRNEGI